MTVVATGRLAASCSVARSAAAFDRCTPPPATTSGALASARSVGGLGDTRRVGDGSVEREGAEAASRPLMRSAGRFRTSKGTSSDGRTRPAGGRRGEGHVDVVVDAVG